MPSAASARTTARPIPREPPVTIATLSRPCAHARHLPFTWPSGVTSSTSATSTSANRNSVSSVASWSQRQLASGLDDVVQAHGPRRPGLDGRGVQPTPAPIQPPQPGRRQHRRVERHGEATGARRIGDRQPASRQVRRERQAPTMEDRAVVPWTGRPGGRPASADAATRRSCPVPCPAPDDLPRRSRSAPGW